MTTGRTVNPPKPPPTPRERIEITVRKPVVAYWLGWTLIYNLIVIAIHIEHPRDAWLSIIGYAAGSFVTYLAARVR